MPAQTAVDTGPGGPAAAAAPAGFTQPPDRARAPDYGRLLALAGHAWPALLIAVILCVVTFLAGAGQILGTMTAVEIGLTLGCGLAAAAAIVFAPAGRPAYGAWPAGLLLAFAGLSALSVVWSVQPDGSWQDAARLFAYSGVFGLAVLLARVIPGRWAAVLGGVLLAAVIVCGYALLTKVFPNRLGSEQIVYYARLREPYGYWNATGLAAALGAIACMWLGARRAGHALLSALAYPAMGIMLVTLLLAYSRGALVALALGLALWFCLVPLRLRGATVLIVGGIGAGAVVGWDFSRNVLTSDHATLAARIDAGHQLGVLLAAMVLALTLAGLAIGFLTGRRAPSARTRQRAGVLLLSLPVIAVLAGAGLLAASHRGLVGSISHGLGSLTNPNAAVPANGPARLTAVGSARARYWNEAFEVFAAHPALGVGAGGYDTARLRYRTKPIHVTHAHGFAVQTLADLGIVGLLLVLALLGAWLVAARRATARSASACSRCCAWSSPSACIPSWTGLGTCPGWPARHCCAPAGSPVADRRRSRSRRRRRWPAARARHPRQTQCHPAGGCACASRASSAPYGVPWRSRCCLRRCSRRGRRGSPSARWTPPGKRWRLSNATRSAHSRRPGRPSAAIHSQPKRCSRSPRSSSTPASARLRSSPTSARCICSPPTRKPGRHSANTSCASANPRPR